MNWYSGEERQIELSSSEVALPSLEPEKQRISITPLTALVVCKPLLDYSWLVFWGLCFKLPRASYINNE